MTCGGGTGSAACDPLATRPGRRRTLGCRLRPERRVRADVSEDDRPLNDHDWNRAARGETPAQRLDRNWRDLLQELRVVQLGVQLLTGLLLTVPFHRSFLELASRQVLVYVVTASLAVLATGLLVTTGVFRAAMNVELVNDGPVTLLLDSRKTF